jgi:hypothetical protein
VGQAIVFCGLPVLAAIVLLLHGPIPQDPAYHNFADQRTIWGIPNFWNTVSNLPFLLVALWSLRAYWSPLAFREKWELIAYTILVIGVSVIARGSMYYHLHPTDQTLFWDRLPMTVAFMSLLASTIGERISPVAGAWLLLPLLLLGAGSVLWWRASGDLRLYAGVQFYPMLALPLMLLLFPPRYTGTAGIWATLLCYGLAKILELADYPITSLLPLSGHTLKHFAGAAAILFYVNTIARRQPLRSPTLAKALCSA